MRETERLIMERLKRLLLEASLEGSVASLLMLLREDPLILDRVTLNLYEETPLHVASILGHVDFVKEILVRKPELAMEFNSQRCLPLHMAAKKGHLETVKALVSANLDTCLVRDRDGRNPLHLAAITGRVEVLKELVRIAPDAAKAMVHQDETILHLCVRYNQLEALKFLVETLGEFVNSKDADGNTVLHLAVADKQIETISFLLQDTAIEVNALNVKGGTAIDILAQGQRDARDIRIRQSLLRVGASEAKTRSSLEQVPEKGESNMELVTSENYANSPKDTNNHDQWLENKRNALMVVASLIATMAFQAGVNPPNGVWQEDFDPKESNSTGTAHMAGESVMAYNYRDTYHLFMIYNTTGFVASLSIILLLISGLPFIKRRVFMWILMVTMWVAILGMSFVFLISILVLTPSIQVESYQNTVNYALFVWCALTALLLIGHTIRLIKRAAIKLWELTRKLPKGIRHTIRLIKGATRKLWERIMKLHRGSSSRESDQHGSSVAAGSGDQTTVQMSTP